MRQPVYERKMGVFKLIKISFFLVISIFLIHFWLTNKSHVFTEEGISAIGKKFSVAGSKNEKELQKIFDNVHAELEKQYPGHILPKRELQWITMSAGGWVGSVCVMHATLTEYVAFFGSAVDTVGASGRYWANISDTVLTGEFHQWPEATHKVNVYKPGDFVRHAWGEATVVNFKGGLWMLEYGRGFLPSTLVFAFADMIFSTQDLVSVYYFLRIYVRGFLWELFADALI